MSRGTRRNDDVLGFDVPAPVVKKPKKLPEDFSFPKGFSIGSGRILMLNKRLLTCYGDIGYHRNCDFEGREPEVDHHGTWRYACSEARAMLIELQALGAETYIPDELESKYVHKPPLLAPFGSLSYLCSSPHYFSPENYPVPTGLPAVDKLGYSHKDRVMLAGSNRYLSMKYRVLAWCLNRIKFYRHQRIRSKLDVSVSLPGNKLEDKIEGCRVLLDEVVSELCKYINLGETTRLFLMPRPLRDNIMEDNGIINLSQLKDISCLYPERWDTRQKSSLSLSAA